MAVAFAHSGKRGDGARRFVVGEADEPIAAYRSVHHYPWRGIADLGLGHIHKMAEVTQTGPYAMCRHPLYLGHFIIAVGFCVVAAASWLAAAIVIPGFFMIYLPTWKNEERRLMEQFGDGYAQYMRNTPAFFPLPTRACLSGRFDWRLVRKHREWNHLALLSAGFLILVAIGYYKGV